MIDFAACAARCAGGVFNHFAYKKINHYDTNEK